MGRLHLKRHLYEERIMLSTFYIQEIKESYQVVHMQRQWPKFSILMTKLQAYAYAYAFNNDHHCLYF